MTTPGPNRRIDAFLVATPRPACPGRRPGAALAAWLLLSPLAVPAFAAEGVGAPDAAQAAAGSAAPAKPAEEPGNLKHLAPAEAEGVLGRPVRGSDGHEIGRVIDVLVDQAGHPRAAVIDFGGFMGVGSRKIAVEWPLLRFTPGEMDKPITLDLTPDQIKAVPEYKGGKTNPTIVAAPPEAATRAAVEPPAVPNAPPPPPAGPEPGPGGSAAPSPPAAAGSR